MGIYPSYTMWFPVRYANLNLDTDQSLRFSHRIGPLLYCCRGLIFFVPRNVISTKVEPTWKEVLNPPNAILEQFWRIFEYHLGCFCNADLANLKLADYRQLAQTVNRGKFGQYIPALTCTRYRCGLALIYGIPLYSDK